MFCILREYSFGKYQFISLNFERCWSWISFPYQNCTFQICLRKVLRHWWDFLIKGRKCNWNPYEQECFWSFQIQHQRFYNSFVLLSQYRICWAYRKEKFEWLVRCCSEWVFLHFLQFWWLRQSTQWCNLSCLCHWWMDFFRNMLSFWIYWWED